MTEESKDLRIVFNTEEGTTTFETPIIEGKLNAVIVDSKEKVSLTIDSVLGYNIYHTREHQGVQYYAPRAVLRGQKLIHFDIDQFDKFKLNEALDIRISGPKNSEVVVIFRID